MSEETVEVECGRCKAKYRVHKPLSYEIRSIELAQVTLMPAWSLTERQCPTCKAIAAPIIIECKVGWQSYMPADKPLIEVPQMQLPKDLNMKVVRKG